MAAGLVLCQMGVVIWLKDTRPLKVALSDVLVLVASGIATGSLWYAARRSRCFGHAIQIAWALLAAGQALVWTLDTYWAIAEIGLGRAPTPSPFDLLPAGRVRHRSQCGVSRDLTQ